MTDDWESKKGIWPLPEPVKTCRCGEDLPKEGCIRCSFYRNQRDNMIAGLYGCAAALCSIYLLVWLLANAST